MDGKISFQSDTGIWFVEYGACRARRNMTETKSWTKGDSTALVKIG
jgi:hypothetical protein